MRLLNPTSLAVGLGAGIAAWSFLLIFVGSRRTRLAAWDRMRRTAAVGSGLIRRLLGRWTRRRRAEQLGTQMTDALPMLVRQARSGRVPLEVVRCAATRAEGPLLRKIFSDVLDRFEVGVSLEEALWDAYGEFQHPLFYRFISALQFSRQSGGDLVHSLAALEEIARRRRRLTAEVAEESAEARYSAMVVASLPLAVAGFTLLSRPEMLEPLMQAGPGRVAAIYAACSWVGGIAYIYWTLSSVKGDW